MVVSPECPNCGSVTVSAATIKSMLEHAHSVEACAHGRSGGGGMPAALHMRRAKARAALIRLSAAVALLLREIEEGGPS